MSLDNTSKNLARIAVLCDQRGIVYNYMPSVDPYYFVIWPGEARQFIIKHGTLIDDIPSEVFADITEEIQS